MTQKAAGHILGDEVGFMPCLWIGIAAGKGRAVPWFPGNSLPEPGAPTDHLSAEQFIFEHQYDGLATSHVTLYGAILPLSSCDDPRIVESAQQLASRYFGDPFQNHWPNLDELIEVRAAMRALGPIEPTAAFRDLGEAHLTFDVSSGAYDWLASHFQMATLIDDNDSFEPVRVTRCEKLPTSLASFLQWMSGPGGSCYPPWIRGAIVYENSD